MDKPKLGKSFPVTSYSVIRELSSGDEGTRRAAFESLARAYWQPVYLVLRLKWQASPEDAEDLTQEFFGRAFEKAYFEKYDPARARFRTFLRTCLDGFVANERKSAGRLKRGGGVIHERLDVTGAESRVADAAAEGPGAVERHFHREWVRSIFGLALDRLQEDCRRGGKETQFALFRRYDLEGAGEEGTTYGMLADEFGLPVTQVTNFLHWARRGFRQHALEVLRELSGSDEEYREDVRELFGRVPDAAL